MEFTTCKDTPIQQLKLNLNNNKFYVKRDDLLPISFGGNKVRKAIHFFNDLYNSESNCVVTYGSSSSNHCRIVANIAASKGIPCYIISPSETSVPTNNSKLTELFGAVIIKCPVSEVSSTINTKLEELRKKGYRPYFIQGGGHGDLGTMAYIEAYEEIVKYEKKNNINFDYIFHTSGTGTTQAGLICGSILNKHNKKIVGISNARKNPYGSQVVLESVNSYLKKKNVESITLQDIIFIDDYVLEGYGSYNKQILRTINNLMVNDGIPFDTTYTGKAFWGMKEFIKKEEIMDNRILFIHTGGTPLFFEKLGELMDG